MLKFKRVSKEWISEYSESLVVFPYDRINEKSKDWTYEEIVRKLGLWWRNQQEYAPYEAIHSETGVDRDGDPWVWVSKFEPDCLYLLDVSPRHPFEMNEEPGEVKSVPILYYTYEPDYTVVGDQSIIFPVIKIVDDSMPEVEFKTLAESGMLFTDMRVLGEHFEVNSRTYVNHPWVQTVADFRLNQKSE